MQKFYLHHFANYFLSEFEPDSPLNEIVKSIPQIAFEDDNLLDAINNKEILIEPSSPSEDVMVAFILDNGALVEFLEIKNPNYKSAFK